MLLKGITLVLVEFFSQFYLNKMKEKVQLLEIIAGARARPAPIGATGLTGCPIGHSNRKEPHFEVPGCLKCCVFELGTLKEGLNDMTAGQLKEAQISETSTKERSSIFQTWGAFTIYL